MGHLPLLMIHLGSGLEAFSGCFFLQLNGLEARERKIRLANRVLEEINSRSE